MKDTYYLIAPNKKRVLALGEDGHILCGDLRDLPSSTLEGASTDENAVLEFIRQELFRVPVRSLDRAQVANLQAKKAKQVEMWLLKYGDHDTYVASDIDRSPCVFKHGGLMRPNWSLDALA